MRKNKSDLIAKLAKLELFSSLDADHLEEIAAVAKIKTLSRGATLITQGEIGNCFYLVLSGRFEVQVGSDSGRRVQIGPGQPIGEIGFIAGLNRTATVRAIRESIVLVLEKAQLDRICENNPTIWHAISIALAKRLAASNMSRNEDKKPVPSTIALIPAGPTIIPSHFIETFMACLGEQCRPLLLSSDNFSKYISRSLRASGDDLASELNALEIKYDHIVYVADPELTKWSKLAIRQADLVLSIGEHDRGEGTDVPLNEFEKLSSSLHKSQDQRLILLHRDKETIVGTAHWLEARDIFMHHHLCTHEKSHYARLVRFILGNAIGFVACGGGALCCAHLGLYKALTHAGIEFDMVGGTSGGAAMVASFALDIDPDEVERQAYDMFVTNKALGRYNFPLFSLLDHTHLDAQLKHRYANTQIEDCWTPYFSVATDISNGRTFCIRRGSLWQAVRASSSLPALLPPFYTNEGEMLVDGALTNNVPVSVMHEWKDGPNIVVSFEQARQVLFPVDYQDIPARFNLFSLVFDAQRRKRLRNTPRMIETVVRSLVANQQDFRAHLDEHDLLMCPHLPEDVGIMDWHESAHLMKGSYEWAVEEIRRLRSIDHPALARIDALLGR